MVVVFRVVVLCAALPEREAEAKVVECLLLLFFFLEATHVSLLFRGVRRK